MIREKTFCYITEKIKKVLGNKEQKVRIIAIAITALVVVFLNLYIGKFALVNGDSMYPTLHNGDICIIQIISYKPAVGDLAVLKTDEDSALGGENVIKRIIAMGGQTVEINYSSNIVYVDGAALEETYISMEDSDPLTGESEETVSYKVPEGYVFVLGDNRNCSMDSRDSGIGCISEENIIGEVVINIPIGRWIK